ncbi:nitroreductase/quinone reductase family protein [Pseudonocardia petroleophila]|uniref:Nitroreductase family deazaflavin-dependent oxidoreductase n=1 Tax=Pseudonocardia petroleophila TaxID=37331 RepID=A0A7G7MQY3_9PSEU|nr:nitroreductase/quinone reductase family protein [Pseudonocardia petroleophila]QNG55194.1 nitroreductase family deazaflavin-dependent oxidoreductase [Pseudonocardia petroleophila]
MPADFVLKAMNTAHRALLKLSGGRVGYDAMGMPVLELTTIGRRSGQPRSVMLTAPLHEDGHPVVVASRGGDDTHPAWFLNLRDRPEVEVSIQGGPRTPMTARIVTAQERARMWPQIAGKYANYAGYQKRTDREIPLVVLEPRA